MEYVLGEIEPKSVFKFFEEITRIPRGSGNEKAVSDYLVSFAKERNLEVVQDKAFNVIIRKPGTKGYENAPWVTLQGHMDMVNVKSPESEHNFEIDPLKLRILEDMIYATDTTLGADNGIAVAYCLAVLDSQDISHPPVEVLLTTDEETGMGGAVELSPSEIKGSILINMDSEEEGHFLVSCAGGLMVTQSLKVDYIEAAPDKVLCSINICGLKGGHSGAEIDKGRGNAIKLLGRVLNDVSSEIDYLIKTINGGVKMNAIPSEAYAEILIDKSNFEKLQAKIEGWSRTFNNEYRTADPDINVYMKKIGQNTVKVFSRDSTEKVVASLVLIPNGVQSMSRDIEGLVESSTNLGVLSTHDNQVLFQSAIRSSVRTLKYSILNQVKMVAKVLGEEVIIESEYPEWQYDPQSKIRTIFERVYKGKYGLDCKIVATHGGVECGLLKEKKEELDIVSFGPNMYDVHTPYEHVSISSVKRTWELLLDVLKEIK